MGRPSRQHEPGGIYHVTSRGNNKAPVFVDEGRPAALHRPPRQVRAQTRLARPRILPDDDPLPPDRQGAGRGALERNVPAQRRLLTEGEQAPSADRAPLQRALRGSVGIDDESHLLEACRYVVLNPVRAGLCDSPAPGDGAATGPPRGSTSLPSFLAEFELLSLFSLRFRERTARLSILRLEGTTRGARHRCLEAHRAESRP